jgi:hypothetical protein
MAGTLTVQTIQGPTSGANANKIIIPAGQTLDIDTWSPPAGTILQVVSNNDNNQTAASTANFHHFSSMDTVITPKSATSKILITVNIFMGNANDDNYNQFRIMRQINGANGVNLGLGQAVGNATQNSWANNGPYTHSVYEVHASSWTYLDTPNTTGQLTYQFYGRAMATVSRTMYLNRPSDVTDANRSSTTSNITLMEIAG